MIRRLNRVLIMRRSAHSPQFAGFWDLPGGSVERGESLEEALLREVREETNLAPKVHGVCHAALVYWVVGSEGPFPRVEVNFLCTLESENEPTLRPEEHSEYAWIEPGDLPRYSMPDVWAEAIRAGFAT